MASRQTMANRRSTVWTILPLVVAIALSARGAPAAAEGAETDLLASLRSRLVRLQDRPYFYRTLMDRLR